MTIFAFLVIARWIHFAAVFLLFGGALFWLYAGSDLRDLDKSPRGFAATRRLLRMAAPIAALSGLAWMAGDLANMTSTSTTPDWSSLGDAEDLRLFFFETNFGAVSILRLALLGGAVGVVAFPLRGRALLVALVVLGGGLLVSQAWLGHAAEGSGLRGAAMIIAYAAHALAAAAWVGGLAPLLFVLAASSRAATDPRHDDLRMLHRFSAMGMIAVTLIILSGIANAGFRVGGSFVRLFDTAYGDTLAVKLALVALMLALASFNRFVAMPRLDAGREGEGKTLFRTIALELALGVFVLAAAAVLGVTPPPQ